MRSLILCAALLSGCATAADLRQSGAFIQTSSAKSVQAVSSCLAEQWAARSGATNMTPRPTGVSLTLSYVVFSRTVAAAKVDVDDQGQQRLVSVYAGKGDRSDKLRREINACV